MQAHARKTHARRSNGSRKQPNRSAASHADWVRRFADCLMLLHPNTVASVVARHVATDPRDSELPPEEAAMKFMFEQPLVDEAALPLTRH